MNDHPELLHKATTELLISVFEGAFGTQEEGDKRKKGK
jgi:hypothetical protein